MSESEKLTSREWHKGTGDVLKDLAHAQRLTDTSEPGFGEVICRGRELDFVNSKVTITGKCGGCGKRLTRVLKAMQTLNPWNTNVEGSVKTRAQVYAENSATLRREKASYRFVCIHCEQPEEDRP